MARPLVAPLTNLVRTELRAGAGRAAMAILTGGLALVAASFLVAAGVVWLTVAIGFLGAALIFAGGFALLAVVAHLSGQARAARRAVEATARRNRATAEVAALVALLRSARPLLPVAAFLAAFALARRG